MVHGCEVIVNFVGLGGGVVNMLICVPVLIEFVLRYLLKDVFGLIGSCDGIGLWYVDLVCISVLGMIHGRFV